MKFSLQVALLSEVAFFELLIQRLEGLRDIPRQNGDICDGKVSVGGGRRGGVRVGGAKDSEGVKRIVHVIILFQGASELSTYIPFCDPVVDRSV